MGGTWQTGKHAAISPSASCHVRQRRGSTTSVVTSMTPTSEVLSHVPKTLPRLDSALPCFEDPLFQSLHRIVFDFQTHTLK